MSQDYSAPKEQSQPSKSNPQLERLASQQLLMEHKARISLEKRVCLFKKQFFRMQCLKCEGRPRGVHKTTSLWRGISEGALREIRSKHFFSSGLVFTWQVSRLSFAGGRLACLKAKNNKKGWGWVEGMENHTVSILTRYSNSKLFTSLQRWPSDLTEEGLTGTSYRGL